jgi:hypothetical protein
MVVGDTVDGFFFNPAQFEQIEQTPEQFKYINSIYETDKRLFKLNLNFSEFLAECT